MEGWYHGLGTNERIEASNLIELAKYAVANKIVEKPAYAWWVLSAVKRQRIMIDTLMAKVE